MGLPTRDHRVAYLATTVCASIASQLTGVCLVRADAAGTYGANDKKDSRRRRQLIESSKKCLHERTVHRNGGDNFSHTEQESSTNGNKDEARECLNLIASQYRNMRWFVEVLILGAVEHVFGPIG